MARGWKGSLMNGYINGWMDRGGWIDRWIEGGWLDSMYGSMDRGWMDGWMDG